jgi:hypothetical protein
LRPRLASWRRYELRKQLADAAASRGEVMKKADCDYVIDKSLATGGLDSNGNLHFTVKGTADEMALQIIEIGALWGAIDHLGNRGANGKRSHQENLVLARGSAMAGGRRRGDRARRVDLG